MKGTPSVVVHADESCLGNGREGENPGGGAGLIEYRAANSDKTTRLDYWVSEPATTNNRMALRSAIEALSILSRKGNRLHVSFVSDSQYLVKGMSEWLSSWKARGWRRKEGEIENLDLWQQLDRLAQAHVMKWQWVRGHNKHPQNEYADHLATKAARDQSSSGGPVPSLYEEWLAGQRAKGRLAGTSDGNRS